MTRTTITTHAAGLSGYEDWLYETGCNPNTTMQRLRFARARLDEWGTLAPTPGVVARWIGRYQGWTRRTYYGHLASLYAWMVETGQIERSPIERVKRGPMPRPKPKPLSRAETVRVLTRAVDVEHATAWVLLASLAGLRSFEIAKFRGEDITEAHVHVVGKGGIDAHVPTHPMLWELAQTYPRSGLWFPSKRARVAHVTSETISSKMHALMAEAGLTGSIHRFRATFGTNMMRNGESMRVIQELMRHRSLTTTQAYLGVLDADLRDAIDRLAA